LEKKKNLLQTESQNELKKKEEQLNESNHIAFSQQLKVLEKKNEKLLHEKEQSVEEKQKAIFQ